MKKIVVTTFGGGMSAEKTKAFACEVASKLGVSEADVIVLHGASVASVEIPDELAKPDVVVPPDADEVTETP